MVNQPALPPLITHSMLHEAAGGQHRSPARDADPLPDPPSPDPTDEEPDRSWIEELAAALRALADKSIRQAGDHGQPKEKPTDEP